MKRHHPKHHIQVLLATALLVSVVLAGCHEPGHVGGDEDGLVIGSVLPMTGGLSAYGPSASDAVELAIAHVNDAGGVNGADVRHVAGDTETTEEGASSAVSNLLNVEEIHALIGPMGSGMSMAIIDQVKAAGIPMVSPSNTGPDFTTLDDGGWYFRTVPSDALQGAVMAMVLQEHGHQEIAIIAANDAYGTGFADVLQSEFTSVGGTVQQYVRYDKEGSDFTTDVESAAGGDPDAIVLIGYPEEGRVIVQNAFERGHIGEDADIEWYFSEGFRAQSFVDEVHAQSSGLLNGYWGTNPEQLTDQSFLDDFQSRFGSEPALFADRTYDAAVLVMLAAERCGCTDGAGIRDALPLVQNAPGEEVTYDVARALELVRDGQDIVWTGAAGPMEWDDVGDVTAPYATWQIVDGQITTQDTGITP